MPKKEEKELKRLKKDAAYLVEHCANCGSENRERSYNVRLIGPVELCAPCHKIEVAIELRDATQGVNLNRGIATRFHALARTFHDACGGGFADYTVIVSTARAYAATAERLGEPTVVRDAMAAARAALVECEKNRIPNEDIRPITRNAGLAVLMRGARTYRKSA